MSTLATRTVRDLVLENPAAARVLDELGIDYCCGGERTLQDACANADITLGGLESRIEREEEEAAPDTRDWRRVPLFGLVDHIVQKYHRGARRDLVWIEQLLTRAVSGHGEQYPELRQIEEAFQEMALELLQHMSREEQLLFPYIVRMEENATRHARERLPLMGCIHESARVMMMQHEEAGEALRKIRTLASDYAAPPVACAEWRALYYTLEEFERGLHYHLHLENNILFPRALELERGMEER